MKRITVRRNYLEVYPYDIGDCTKLEYLLSVYDSIYHKSTPIGFVYNEEEHTLRIPIGFGIYKLAKMIGTEDVVLEDNPDKPRKVVMTLVTEPKDRLQRNIIGFFVNPKNDRIGKTQVGVIAGTGIGKTYCAIASMTFTRSATMVVSNSAHLRSQWIEKLDSYTTIIEDERMEIKSSSDIEKLFKEKHHRAGFYSVTHGLLQEYGSSHSWERVGELFEELGIGCLIIDEAHKHFANTVRLLTSVNTQRVMILTATFQRSDHSDNRVFQSVFGTIPKFVQKEVCSSEDGPQKHITGVMVTYAEPMRPDTLSRLVTKKGLNGAKYCTCLVDKGMRFHSVLKYLMDNFSIKRDMKTMVFCGSIYAADYIFDMATQLYHGKKIGKYHSKVPKKEKENVLTDSDIIVTTSKSLGEGTDIDGLHCVINIEAYSSPLLAQQCPGRLRNLDDGVPYYYCEIVNRSVGPALRQYNSRRRIFRENFGAVKVLDFKE